VLDLGQCFIIKTGRNPALDYMRRGNPKALLRCAFLEFAELGRAIRIKALLPDAHEKDTEQGQPFHQVLYEQSSCADEDR